MRHLALLLAFTIVGAPAARAELSCHDFTQGMVLNDPDVMREAVAVFQPLLRTGADIHAVLPFVEDKCSQLPDVTVEKIIAAEARPRR